MSAAEDEGLEQTMFISRQVDVYNPIPPRQPTGYKSGEWLVSSKIWSGRMRVVSIGPQCSIRLEDPNTDELFAACPVPYGMRNVCVEAVSDSSRYFVLRVEDPSTKRHAFLGLGFQQRSEAFDFNDALIKHERFVERERASSQISGGAATDSDIQGAGGQPAARSSQPSVQAAAAAKEVAALYTVHGDLSLKDGQTIHVNVKPKPVATTHAGSSTWLKGSAASVVPVVQGAAGGGLFKLAPPPADVASGPGRTALPSASNLAQPSVGAAAVQAQSAAAVDLLGGDLLSGDLQSHLAAGTLPTGEPTTAPQPAGQSTDWAVFD